MRLKLGAVGSAVARMLAEIDRPNQTPESVLEAAAKVLSRIGFVGVRYYEIAREQIPDVTSEQVCYLSWCEVPDSRDTTVGFSIPWSETSLAIENARSTTQRMRPAVHSVAWLEANEHHVPDWIYRLGLEDSAWIDIPVYDRGTLLGLLASDWPGLPGDLTEDVTSLLSALGTLVGTELAAASQPLLSDLWTQVVEEQANAGSADELVIEATKALREILQVASASVFKFNWPQSRVELLHLELSPNYRASTNQAIETYEVGEYLTGRAWNDEAYRTVLDFEAVRLQRPELAAARSISFHGAVLHEPLRSIIYAPVGQSEHRYMIRLMNRDTGSNLPFLRERSILSQWADQLGPFVDTQRAASRANALQALVPLMAEPIDLAGIADDVAYRLKVLEDVDDVKILAHRLGNDQPHYFYGYDRASIDRIRKDAIRRPRFHAFVDAGLEAVLSRSSHPGDHVTELADYLALGLGSGIAFPFSSGATRGVLMVVAPNARASDGLDLSTKRFIKQIAETVGQAVESSYIAGQSQGALRALSLVGHELATPVAALGSVAQLALEVAKDELSRADQSPDATTPPSYFDDLSDRIQFNLELVDAAVQIGKVVGQAVDRRFVGIRKPETLRRLLNHAISQASAEVKEGRLAAPSGIVIDRPSGDGSLSVNCDRGMVVIALSNLYRNALKYSLPASRSPSISTHIRTATNSVGRTYADIELTNEGLEIPEDAREMIFLEFYRHVTAEPDLAIRGMGLGLFLVRQIAKAHGGDATLVRCDPQPYTYQGASGERLTVFRTTFRLRMSCDLGLGNYEYQLPRTGPARSDWGGRR